MPGEDFNTFIRIRATNRRQLHKAGQDLIDA